MTTKVLSLNKSQVITLTTTVGLLAVASILPLFHNQAVTGPLVNATLFLGVILAGTQNAILIGLIPSMIALSVGLLPAPLAPMIPFIMLSNTILIITFSYLKQKNFWLGIISASILKFLFLFSTTSIITSLLLKKELAPKVASILSWPQLVTALAGGIIAFIVLKILKREKRLL